jgi:hypothetical protein
VKEAYMTSEAGSIAKSGQESVVIASFDSYRHAEHMLASLGREFRKKARNDATTAVVLRGNPDGSLKVTQSRVLSAGDLMSTLIRLSLSWTIGFMGLISTLKGAKEGARAVHVREGHTGSDEHRAHGILADAGQHRVSCRPRTRERPRLGARRRRQALRHEPGPVTTQSAAAAPDARRQARPSPSTIV